MKKSLLLSVLPLTFALMVSTTSMTWGADDEKIEIVEKTTWAKLSQVSLDSVREIQGNIDGRKREITKLKADLKALEHDQDLDSTKSDIHTKSANAGELFGRLENYCNALLADAGDDSMKSLLGGIVDGTLHSSTASKNASQLLGYLQEISIRVPSPQNRGDLTILPFEARPTELKVGQNLFIPGACVEGSNRKILDLKHVREDGVSYWTLSNGSSGGNAINDKVDIEGDNYNVVVFPGTARRPDGSTLILFAAPVSASSRETFFFRNITNEGEENAQVNCAEAGSGLKVAYPLSSAKQDNLELIVPGSIVSGLSIISKYSKEVSDIKQLSPVYDMVVNGVKRLQTDINTLLETAENIVKTYEAMK